MGNLMRFFVFNCILLILFTGCGLGQGELELPPSRPAGIIQGKVLGGLYSGGKVSAFTATSKTERKFLASSEVQENGEFTLPIIAPSQAILIEVNDGNFFDPGTIESITPTQSFTLSTIVMYQSGETIESAVTPLSHLAAGLMLYDQNTTGININESIYNATNAKFNDVYFTNLGDAYFDIQYQETTNSLAIDGDEKQGLFLFALSQIANKMSLSKGDALKAEYNLATLTSILYEDISTDGLLDGKSLFETEPEIKSLAFGDIVIDFNFYRLKMAFSLKNALRFSPLPIFENPQAEEDYIFSIAQSKSSLFGETNDDALHESTPIIKLKTKTELAKNALLNLEFLVEDALKLKSINLTLDENEFAFEPNETLTASNSFISILLDSSEFPDGEHQLKLVVTDSFDNISNFQSTIVFDNTPPQLFLKSTSLSNESDFLLKGQFHDEYSDISKIVVDGEEVSLTSDSEWEKAVKLDSGHNEFLIEITDALGNKAEVRTHVLFDEFAPVITLSSAILTNTSQFELQGEIVEGESSIRLLTINGNSVNNIENQKWSMLVSLHRGTNEFTIGVEDEAGNYGEFTTAIVLDDVIPAISVTSPILTNNREFNLQGEFIEDISGIKNITVNNTAATIIDTQKWSIPVLLEAGDNEYFIHIEDQAGNALDFKTRVTLDINAPVASMTSEPLTNTSQYLLTGNFVEAESGINRISVNEVEATILDENNWESAVLLNQGINEFKIEITDDAGNIATFSTAVFLDATPPSIQVSSVEKTNLASFQLTGIYIENESGVANILINGSEADIINGNQWSYNTILETGQNEFSIQIIDKANNTSEITHNILLDDLAPTINFDNTVSVRFSNGDGSHFKDVIQPVNIAPLYIELPQLSLQGMEINKTNLEMSEIPYFSFFIEDPFLSGFETSVGEISIRYRYWLNDVEIVPWQDIAIEADSSNIILPLVTETLSTVWYKSSPDDSHKIELQASDNFANATIATLSFKTQFFTPILDIVENETIETIKQGDFATRNNFINKEVLAAAYTINNSLQQRYKMRIRHDGQHTLKHSHETVQREHQVRKISTESWQRSTITDVEIDCPQLNNDWHQVFNMWNRINNEWVEIFPQETDLGIIDVFTDTPQVPAGSDWENFSLLDPEIKRFLDPLEGETLFYEFDYIFELGEKSLHAIYNQPAYLRDWQLILTNGQTHRCDTDEPLIAVQTKTDFQYLPIDDNDDGIPDYPRNIITNESLNFTFETSKIVLLDETGEEITPIDDWYSIPVNQNITLLHFVKTPEYPIFEDAMVRNPDSIIDYDIHSFDKVLEWEINNDLILETQFNPDNLLDDTINVKQQKLEKGNMIVKFNRE